MLNMIGIFIFHPKIDGYPKAKFPGVVVFSEIYQGMSSPLGFFRIISSYYLLECDPVVSINSATLSSLFSFSSIFECKIYSFDNQAFS